MTKRFLPGLVASGLMFLACAGFADAQTKGTSPDDDNPSAYTALRLVSKTLGRDSLDRVVEVSGRDGVPQPFLWRIVLKEGSGSREVDVAGGKITAQRPLERPPSSSTSIQLADLNLDSSGAFDAIDAQAHKVKLRYDSLNYVLRVSPATGKPVWTINLLDKGGSEVGVIRLAAHDGTTLSTDGRLANNASPTTGPNNVGSTATTSARPPMVRETPRPVSRPPVTTHQQTTVSTTTVRTTNVPPPLVNNTTTSTTTTQEIPVARLSDRDVDDSESPVTTPEEQGGLFTRTGRTLDHTSHTVEHHLRRAGATVQRFFTGHSDIDQDNRHDE